MKVVLVGTGRRPIPPVGYGGIERTIGELAEALRREGAAVEILNQVTLDRYTRGWTFERHLLRRLGRSDADIVHAHTSRAGVMLGVGGRPFVYTTHTPHWFFDQNPLQSLLFERERQSVRWAAATVALSARLATVLQLVRRRAGPVVTIPLGVDTEKFRATREPEPHAALGVGSVEPRKRWHLAAAAVAGTGIRFRLAGPTPDPDYADRLRAAGVELLGVVDETRLITELSRASFLFHPSGAEVMPGAVLQAMACGRVVLGGPAVSEIPGTLAAASNDEVTVTAFLRTHAAALDQDPARAAQLGREAREVVEREFRWPLVARAHLELYRRVLENRKR